LSTKALVAGLWPVAMAQTFYFAGGSVGLTDGRALRRAQPGAQPRDADTVGWDLWR